MNPSSTTTSVITAQQIAALIDRDPSLISACKDVLPEPIPMHTGQSGRPQLCYRIEDIVDFVMNRTGFMSEIQARLCLALSPEHRRPKGQPKIVDRDDGSFFVAPTDLSRLSSEELDAYRVDRAKNHTALQNSRAKRIPNRSPSEE
ncbi:hypothetical protein [Pseudomonas umsongensis]|uniref:Uncharacterized protein n=1 Tax=Pseudomonas umsongensis TaxID=198618 RepID=A0AAE7DD68_9PSED|nr:hypothetical protein [Pseudomonas umsongensis]QJC78209.1 hypothetical protein HGP31_07765 [Pseudomonas umsongensis]